MVTPGFRRPTGFSQCELGGDFLFGEGVEPPEAGRLIERPRAVAIEGARRQHADDAVRLVVEQQIALEDAGIAAEMLLPRGVAQDHHAIGAGLILFAAGRSGR